MFAGEPYNALDPELLAERARCRALVERYNATAFADGKRRSALLDEILGDRGEDTLVMAPFQCDYGYRIRIGAHTFINYGAVMLDAAEVVIGEHVQIGPNVQLITALHPLDAHTRATGIETAAPVTIEDHVWLAAGVIVCPGVTVGAESVIGAGSVVTRSMPAAHLCVGNPCRVVRAL